MGKGIKRAIAVLLSAILMMTMLPADWEIGKVQAASAELYVGRVRVTEQNASDVLGDGTVSYQAASNTLTLRNMKLTDYLDDSPYVYGIRYKASGQTLNLVLEGKNSISIGDVDGAKECYGIYLQSGNTLNISGTGTLDIKAGAASECSRGISTGNLTMGSGTVVSLAGTSSKYDSTGVHCAGDINMTGGSLTGKGAAAPSGSTSTGVCSVCFRITGGAVTGEGGEAGVSEGIHAGSTTFIEGGTVTATGGSAGSSSYGFRCYASVYIDGGTAVCTGGSASQQSSGIYVYQSGFYIADGILEATGGSTEKGASYGAECHTWLELTGGERVALFGNTQAYKIVNGQEANRNTFGDSGCTLFTVAGASKGTASSVAAINNNVLEGNKYVGVTAKMDITLLSSFGGTYTITPNQTKAVAKGTKITVNPVPANKFRLEKITVSGKSGFVRNVLKGNTFTMPGYPVTIAVDFELIPCVHKPGNIWSQDPNRHYHSCTLCYKVLDAAPHSDKNNDGKCDVCGYVLNSGGSGNTGGSSTNSGGSTGGSSSNTNSKKPYVKLNVSSIPLQVGKSTSAVKITSKYPSNDKVKSYKSSNSKVAKVNSKGKVTAKKKGKATITVTMKSGAKAKYTVKVQKGKVSTKSLKLNKKTYTMKKGKTFTLKAVRNPITATEKITWSSSDKKKATVNKKTGKVTAKKKGTVKITARTSNGKKAVCKVTIK